MGSTAIAPWFALGNRRGLYNSLVSSTSLVLMVIGEFARE